MRVASHSKREALMKLIERIRAVLGKILFVSLSLAAISLAAPNAHAATYALILWIGDYANPEAGLEGIDRDAQMARMIAERLGVPAQNIEELRNQELPLEGFRAAMKRFAQRLQPGDNAFIYYSGHGFQRRARGGGQGCTEGIITYDMQDLYDTELTEWLVTLGRTASRIVFMNDSCFSGGHYDGPTYRGASHQPKRWKRPGEDLPPGFQCGRPMNDQIQQAVRVAKNRGANVTYIAAASSTEIAFATPVGSTATIGWTRCIDSGSGQAFPAVYQARALVQCAQQEVRRQGKAQTITLLGDQSASVALAPRPVGTPEAEVTVANVFGQIRGMASPSVQVTLRVPARELMIGRDVLEGSVATNVAGYLHLVYAGADGRRVTMLFPNALDRDNYFPAGTHKFPRPSWQFKVSGPPGAGQLLAILTSNPRELIGQGSSMPAGSSYRQTNAVVGEAVPFVIEATASNTPAPGRFGVSEVVPIRVR